MKIRKSVFAVLLCAALFCAATQARPQAAREATIEPETKARLVLQSHINSKLNEPGDPITAVLDEPIYAGSDMVLGRGTEFHGKVAQVTPAGRGQKNGKIVHAWAAEGDMDVTDIRSNTFRMEFPPRSGRWIDVPEADRAEWFSLEVAAVKVISGQQGLLEELAVLLSGS